MRRLCNRDCTRGERWVNLDCPHSQRHQRPASLATGHNVAVVRLLLFGGEARANQLLVVAGEDVLVGKAWMRPAHAAALSKLLFCWLQQFRSADFVVALGREP